MSAIAFPKPDASILARRDEIIAGLSKLVAPDCLITAEDERRAFDTDALTAYRRMPLAVVLPRTTEQVSAVMRYCSEAGVYVVPRGAGTSLAGGAIPQEDAVVIGVSKLNQVLDFDRASRTIRVQSGITNIAVSAAVGPEGFFYAPDPSSQLACTIAGNIAMNSGGAHCLKYGVTTNNILAAKLVLIDGTIVEIGGEALDVPGPDLLGLVVGSEGQLGIVTEATLRVLPMPEGARPVLFGFDSSEDAGAAVAAIIAAGIIPVAMEFMDKQAIEICEAFAKAGYPLDVEAMLIIEVEGSDAEIEASLARIVAIARQHGVRVVKESKSAMETAQIWKGRKSAFGATGRVADYICMDGTIPTGQLPYVLGRMSEIVAGYGLRVANVFHAGDGNLHPLILFNANDPEDQAKAEDAGNDILKLCVEVGGCLTGEHGVGIEKRDLMGVQFNRVDLDQQMRVRAAFDPDWRLNPAKVFPLSGTRIVTAPLYPTSEDELAEMVAQAADTGTQLAIVGGGTRGAIGGQVEGVPISTLGLTGITLYEPAEMVISARAGTPVAEIEATLAQQGQMLAFEPMDHRPLLGRDGTPTIGALAAANISGPRRISVGAARDHLIGVRLVNGRGEAIKSGGRVMKNVTGLDLVKLSAGALGTLGVLSEVTFKVLPRPETAITLCIESLAAESACDALTNAMGTPFDVSAAAFLPSEGAGAPSRTLFRIEGFAESCAYRFERLAGPSGHFWRRPADRGPGERRALGRYPGREGSCGRSVCTCLARAHCPLQSGAPYIGASRPIRFPT